MEVQFFRFLSLKKMKIKNVIFIFISSICLSSCLTTSFQTVHNEPNVSGGYPQEKWLFITSDVPVSLQKDFDDKIVQFLEDCYGENFVNYKTDRNKYLLPNFLYEVDKDLFINQLNRANEIHFYLHVKSEVLHSGVGAGLDLNSTPPRGVNSYKESRIQVTFEVIDIIKKESVYSQSVVGTTTKDDNARADVYVSLPLDNQFKKAFKRAFKNFKKDFPCNYKKADL